MSSPLPVALPSNALCRSRNQLHVPWYTGQTPLTEISVQSVSGWTKHLIGLAYKLSIPDDLRIAGIHAHEVRTLAASLNLHVTIALDSLLQACSWSSHTVFSSFYLRDMAAEVGGLLMLSPFSGGWYGS